MPDRKICKRLKTARQHAGYVSAHRFASINHISPTTYYNHENGEFCIGVPMLLKYSRLLNVPFDWLILGKKKKNKENTGVFQ